MRFMLNCSIFVQLGRILRSQWQSHIHDGLYILLHINKKAELVANRRKFRFTL